MSVKRDGKGVRSYCASQLKDMGCGEVSAIRKYLTAYKHNAFVRIVNGNETNFYSFSLLPARWQDKIDVYEDAAKEEQKRKDREAKFAREEAEAQRIAEQLQLQAAELPLNDEDREVLWEGWSKANHHKKGKAQRRSEIITAWRKLVEVECMDETVAAKLLMKEHSIKSMTTLYNWRKKAGSVDRVDRVAALVGQGGGRPCDFDEKSEWWVSFGKDYFRRRGGSLASCYRRLEKEAKIKGWDIPTEKTVGNYIKRMPITTVTLLREGPEAVEKLVPPQERDHSMFEAMEAINGDGYVFDRIYVDFGNGVIAKPVTWFWADIRSSKILAWHTDVSENTLSIRLATSDLINNYSLPKYCFIDNTRAAANKTMTGGVPNRYRYKVKDDDPLGILPSMGIIIHWTKPGHGQSKPVERTHGIGGMNDFYTLPELEGRGSKKSPIPIAEFEKILTAFINEMNCREGRRGQGMNGRSFNAVFTESYEAAVPRKATEMQRFMCLLSVDTVTVNRNDGHITLPKFNNNSGQNRYWNEALLPYRSQKITVKFDPHNLHDGVYCVALTGELICKAGCTNKGGFLDADAAAKTARLVNGIKKKAKESAALQEKLTRQDAEAKALPIPEDALKTEHKVVGGMFKTPKSNKVTVEESEGKAGNTGMDPIFEKNFNMMLEKYRKEQENKL